MADNIFPESPLPTLDRLGTTIPHDVDYSQIAKSWFKKFASSMESQDTKALSALFLPDGWWRDILSLTWEFRTFSGLPNIVQFLEDRLRLSNSHTFVLRENNPPALEQPYPDLAWITLMFDFKTNVGIASGVARLVPVADGAWKAHTVFTNLESLKSFPELPRNSAPNHGNWEEDRKNEREFTDKDPTVLVVGAGHCGLALAARLKALNVSTLVLEKHERIGDNWRNRYDSLCLHDPVWFNHLPYLPFPAAWPVYAPARKFANWLEHYAEALDLNVWTSSNVVQAAQDPSTAKWSVTVEHGPDGKRRVFTVTHLVLATGLGGPEAQLPSYPGMDNFQGQVLHSLWYKKAADHLGEKVVIVGACTSAHDIAVDHYEHGIDVTMYQRSSSYIMSCKNGWDVIFRDSYWEDSPPVDIADTLSASFPLYMSIGLMQRSTKEIGKRDKGLLDGLRNVGFQLNDGILGTGFGLLAWVRGGGYYFDTGASKLIADGKIKLKTGSGIKRFTEDSIVFEDGSELSADVVVFATGLGNPKDHVKKICGDAVANRCRPVGGLDLEGEVNGVWRDLGANGLWYARGNLAGARFNSKYLALQIKAIEEGIFGERYSSKQT